MIRLPRAPLVRDLLLGAALAAAAEVELLLLDPSRIDGAVLGHGLVVLLLVPAVALRRVAPFWSMVVAAVGVAFQPLMGTAPIATPYLALLFLLASLGWYAGTRTGALAVAITLLAGLTYDVTTADFSWADLLVNAVIIVLAWGSVHTLRQATDRRVAAEMQAERAGRDERERISRDLHDSLAHALTLITLQAGSVRERTEETLPRDTLAGIERTGRVALTDLNRFLGLLGPRDQEAPGLADLPDLVDGIRRNGLAVDLQVDGGDLQPSIATTVYRVVQEGLTNVVRHSDSSHARVEVRREDRTVVTRVTDEGGAVPARVNGSGRGLAGLRERLALFDGTLESGPTGSGWHLEARIPLGGG